MFSVFDKLISNKLQSSGRATDLPCTPGGGSPSLHKVNPCITGPLLTKQVEHYLRCCGSTSTKPTSADSVDLHRVERPNPEISTKVGATTLLQFIPATTLSNFSSVYRSRHTNRADAVPVLWEEVA